MADPKHHLPHRLVIAADPGILERLDPAEGVLIHDDADVVIATHQRMGERLKQIHFKGPLSDAVRIQKHEKQIVKVFADSKNHLIQEAKHLREKPFLVCPSYPVQTREDISMVTSMGLAVDLVHILDHLPPAAARDILEYYLHTEALSVPIEPFHAVLLSKMTNANLSLWHLNLVYPGQFLYADHRGLAEDPDELRRGEYMFVFTPPGDHPKATGRDSSLQDFFDSLPRRHPQCLACRHYHICAGWGVYKKESCGLWIDLLDALQSASRELRALESFDRDNPSGS